MEFGGHLDEHIFGHLAGALAISFEADGERGIEEDSLDFDTMFGGDFEVWLALGAGEVGGVDVGDRAVDFEALDEQVADGGEDARVDRLVGFVVG